MKRIDNQVKKIREEIALINLVPDTEDWAEPRLGFNLITNPIKAISKARYCECGTKLSMYNLENKCYSHLKAIAY